MTTLVLIVIVILVCVFCAGLIAEALRIAPKTPEQLYWAPEIPIRYVDIDGNRIRYIKTGSGPNLVLLHTLRTQLDIFEKLVPLLEKSFTVYALDYPGHGFSDIPQTDYRPELFVKTVEGFLDKLDLSEVTLAGISIGGVIPLIIAAKKNKRVKKVIAINPYDYGRGSGLSRANAVAGVDFHPRQGAGAGGDGHAAPQRGLGEPHLAGRRRRSQTPSRLGSTRSSTPRACGPVTITPSSISFAMPITGTRRGRATARSTCRCSWSMASRTGRALKSGNARSSRFLERGSRWWLTADIFCRSTSPSDWPRSSSASLDRVVRRVGKAKRAHFLPTRGATEQPLPTLQVPQAEQLPAAEHAELGAMRVAELDGA